MKQTRRMLPIIAAVLLATGCQIERDKTAGNLAGAWRGKVNFTSGAFAAFKDVEFMYVFNAGGTMTESSNYDAAPPEPPAYGAWRIKGARQYEARYEFFLNKAPANFDEIAKGGGWAPDGLGVLSEQITVTEDGKHFDSTIRYELFDQQGKPIPGGGEAICRGERFAF